MSDNSSGNTVFIEEIDSDVHVSCSDAFTDGTGDKNGPDGTPWLVSSYQIVKEDGTQCGGQPLPPPEGIVNTATATATAGLFGLEASDSATVELLPFTPPELTLVKTGPASAQAGGEITFDIVVTYIPNDGPAAPDAVPNVADELCDTTLSGPSGSGPVWKWTCTYTVTGNEAPATAQPPATPANGINYEFVFYNSDTGANMTVSGNSASNTVFIAEIGQDVHVSCSDAFTDGTGDKNGPDGDPWLVSSYAITKTSGSGCSDELRPAPDGVVNTATATATANGVEPEANDTAVVPVVPSVAPELVVTKSADTASAIAGETVTYTVVVDYIANDGPAAPDGPPTVTDPLCELTLPVEGPANTWTYECTYVVTGDEASPTASTQPAPTDGFNYEFVFVNSVTGEFMTVSGSSPNNTPFLDEVDSIVHVSCSDAFTDGTGDKNGPDGDPWLVASYSITKNNGDVCADEPLSAPPAVVNTATATATASVFNLEATGTAVVPIETVPGSSDIEAGTVSFDHHNVDIELINNGPDDLFITEFEVSWPAANKKLKKLKLDGDTFFDRAPSPSSVIAPSDWKDGPDKRTLGANSTETLRLEFEADAALTGYDITITFDDGTSINLVF